MCLVPLSACATGSWCFPSSAPCPNDHGSAQGPVGWTPGLLLACAISHRPLKAASRYSSDVAPVDAEVIEGPIRQAREFMHRIAVAQPPVKACEESRKEHGSILIDRRELEQRLPLLAPEVREALACFTLHLPRLRPDGADEAQCGEQYHGGLLECRWRSGQCGFSHRPRNLVRQSRSVLGSAPPAVGNACDLSFGLAPVRFFKGSNDAHDAAKNGG